LLIHITGIVNISSAELAKSSDCPGPGCPGKSDNNGQVMMFPYGVPSAEEMSGILFNNNNNNPDRTTSIKMKSISFRENNNIPSHTMLTFSSNSFELSDISKQILDAMGQLMIGKHYVFHIEGHSDNSGSRAYNQQLSKKRAEVAKHYLMAHFDIESGKLHIVWKGEDQPLDRENPKSNVNRRVQIDVLLTKENHTEIKGD